ncbi:helix-turn-helix domain-containing protein [Tenacibaculum sp. M341]|uniref:helix-turn-helix domain-containing protein n=1 Tax=Tenacibaculum sp. M341 TaxID=2530339 RepID=UPI001404904E|nr:AraC family transcriptional regulator [Tenacibaculum sp. M341]
MSFDILEHRSINSKNDSVKKLYAKAFLLKAKKEKNTIKIADGYYSFSNIYRHTPKGVKYADSILTLKINQKNSEYPAKGYLQKGIQLYYLAKYTEALDNYLKANEFYGISNDKYGQLCVKHYIGLLKNQIDDKPKESLKIFRENLLFFNNKEKKATYQKQYLKSLFALADSYNRNNVLDSAEIINKKGISESFNNVDKYLYPHFLSTYGITMLYKKEYDMAIDSLLKSRQLFQNDKTNIAISNINLYKALLGKEQEPQAIEYLKQNDSLFKLHSEILFQAKISYEHLLKYYKKNNDDGKYLKTIESLLNIDSIVKNKHENLSKKIVNKYEIPILISEKERIIDQLNKANFSNKQYIIILILLTSLFLFFTFHFYRKSLINKKRFIALMNKNQKQNSIIDNKKSELIEVNTTKSTGLSEELVKEVLNKLSIFENSNKFIKKSYTLNTLAKELKTNSTYLSKIINSSKKVNFSNYLNGLRINYAIDKLKTEKSFRRYTVQAIAEEAGFNKAQSFSTAFQKKTGISITYFIKQLNEHKTTEKQDI